MQTTRITAPAFTLINDTTLRQWLRIDDDVDTETVDLLLASATDYLQGQTNLVLAAADYRVDYDALSPCMSIPLFPINTVHSVSAVLEDGTAVALDATAYKVRIATRAPTLTVLTVPEGTVSIAVSANAGYETQASVPASLQHAAALIVASGYDGRSALDEATTTSVSNLISQYRRVYL